MAEVRHDLGERKAAVLRAVVEEYVRTGEPVGSEKVAESYGLGVSSATIRNEMSALEELGYLSHPHTSAGRVPTDLGYRGYVDALPQRARLGDSKRRAIAEFFEQTAVDMEDLLVGSTRLLSQLTQYAGLAVTPSSPEERLARIELVELGSGVLLLAVGQHGHVYKAVIDRTEARSDTTTEVNQRLLSYRDVTFTEATERARGQAAEAPPGERRLLQAVAQAFVEMQSRAGSEHVVVGGLGNLAVEVASWRLDTMRRLFDAIERETEVLRVLLEAGKREDLAVTIGHEHPTTGMWDAAVVAAPYRAGDVALGTIGIVGPTRMNYASAMTAVRAVARRLSDLATALEE